MKMKNIIVVTALTFLTISVFSQSIEREETRKEMRSFFDKSINSFLVEQQSAYIDKLSDDEKTIIESLKHNKPEFKKGKKGENRNSSLGGFEEKRTKLNEIVDTHPDLNSKYKKAIGKEIVIWKNELKKIHEKRAVESGKEGRNNSRYEDFFERISKPQALLMWSEDNVRNQKRRMKNKSGNGHKSHAYPKELRSEVKEYFLNEIAPVINDERKEFDVLLTDDERMIIDEARQKIVVRKTMFNAWYESEEFEPGKRAKDADFDEMRTDMRKSMEKVREIAGKHKEELKQSMGNISENKNKWMSDIRSIAQSYSVEPRETIHSSSRKYRKFLSPVKFLLIDPDKSPDNLFVKESGIKVFVYPNPISTKGTIVITGAIDKNVKVTLYSSSGDIVEELHKGIIDMERYEIILSTEDLDDKLYILKVTSGESTISRKLIIE